MRELFRARGALLQFCLNAMAGLSWVGISYEIFQSAWDFPVDQMITVTGVALSKKPGSAGFL